MICRGTGLRPRSRRNCQARRLDSDLANSVGVMSSNADEFINRGQDKLARLVVLRAISVGETDVKEK